MAEKDRESHPGTEAFTPDFSDDPDTADAPNASDVEDTGTQSWAPDFDDDTGSQPVPAFEKADEKSAEKAAKEPAPEESEPGRDTDSAGGPVQSVTVPGRYFYLKWWKLALVVLGVWVVAGEVGLDLFYWWYHTIDKTPAVFVVLVYVVACTVCGVMLAMVQGRPLLSALSIAVMSGPFASVAAAAPLYGSYYCARVGHCILGIVPY